MSDLKPYTQDGWEAVKLLIWNFQKIYNLNQAQIADAIGRNRATVSSDLSKVPSNWESEKKLFEIYATWLVAEARSRKNHKRYFRSLFEEILTEKALAEICPVEPAHGAPAAPAAGRRFEVVTDAVTLLRHSGYAVDEHSIRRDPNGLPRLAGLSILVRPSNETVDVTEADGTSKLEYGVSVSLLNIVPEYVQTGAHHPLFKLRQRGTGGSAIDIEGLILCQDDRIVLTGRDDGQRRNMMASIYFRREAALNYRDPPRGGPRAALQGVMLGVSNSKNHFCSLFTLFALPGGLLPEADLQNESAVNAFRGLYGKARDATGVFPERKVAEVLRGLNIEDPAGEVGRMLQKSGRPGARVFSVAM